MAFKSIVATLALAAAGATAAPSTPSAHSTGPFNFSVFALDYVNPNAVPLRFIPNHNSPPGESFFYIGVDHASKAEPVVATLTGGLWTSTTGAAKGHTGFLSLQEHFDDSNLSQYLVSFGDAAKDPEAKDNNWFVNTEFASVTSPPLLAHKASSSLVPGFVLCTATFNLQNGPWSFLAYQTYDKKSFPHHVDNCTPAIVIINSA